MMADRGKIELGGLDDFEPTPKKRGRGVKPADDAAAAHGFTSRESDGRKGRKRGRAKSAFDDQINIRARTEDIEFFQRVADERGVAYGRLFQEVCDHLRSQGSNS